MSLDPAVQAGFEADVLEQIGQRRTSALATATRQSDGAQMDNRSLGGFLALKLFESDDPNMDALLNTAIRTPSTIEHPTYSAANNPAAQAKTA